MAWLFDEADGPAEVRLKTLLVLHGLAMASRHFEKRLAALEARPELKYCGVWLETASYDVANIVTYRGSMWFSKVSNNGAKPGTPDGHWQLIVKAGRDGKDAR